MLVRPFRVAAAAVSIKARAAQKNLKRKQENQRKHKTKEWKTGAGGQKSAHALRRR